MLWRLLSRDTFSWLPKWFEVFHMSGWSSCLFLLQIFPLKYLRYIFPLKYEGHWSIWGDSRFHSDIQTQIFNKALGHLARITAETGTCCLSRAQQTYLEETPHSKCASPVLLPSPARWPCKIASFPAHFQLSLLFPSIFK